MSEETGGPAVEPCQTKGGRLRDWCDATEIACYLGILPGTVRSYVRKGYFPPSERVMDGRPMWARDTVLRYEATRMQRKTKAYKRTRDKSGVLPKRAELDPETLELIGDDPIGRWAAMRLQQRD